MGLLDGISKKDYYEGQDLGNYQFVSLDNIITLNNHPFITGEKIYYNATDEVATGLEPGLFYVYKIDKNILCLVRRFSI